MHIHTVLDALVCTSYSNSEGDGLNYWPHFGEVLLDLNDIELRIMFARSKSPSLAIVNKWRGL